MPQAKDTQMMARAGECKKLPGRSRACSRANSHQDTEFNARIVVAKVGTCIRIRTHDVAVTIANVVPMEKDQMSPHCIQRKRERTRIGSGSETQQVNLSPRPRTMTLTMMTLTTMTPVTRETMTRASRTKGVSDEMRSLGTQRVWGTGVHPYTFRGEINFFEFAYS